MKNQTAKTILGALLALGSAYLVSRATRNTEFVGGCVFDDMCDCSFDFGDAISAIAESDMVSNYKNTAMTSVPLNADPAVYKAIISIANSDMVSVYKAEAIEKICK